MRDPFPAARINGILALSATQSFYSLKETATKVMPALCHLTMDPEKIVRDQAFKALKGFVGKLEKVSEDPSLAEQMEADLNTSGSEVTTASATWASWAVSSLTSKFYRSSTTTTNPAGNVSGGTLSAGTSSATIKTGTQELNHQKDDSRKQSSSDSERVSSKMEAEGNTQTEGWDDDWIDEDEVVFDENDQPESSKPTSTQPSKQESNTGWEDDFLNESSWNESKAITRRKSEVETAEKKSTVKETRPRGVKGSSKGPLKLGAQKIS